MPSASKRNSKSMFDTFPAGKKFAIFLTTILLIASIICFNVPSGLAFFAILFIIPLFWKSPEDQDPINGMMTFDSRAWKTAQYMDILKKDYRSHIFSPLVMLGFGPPEDDTHKDLQAHMFSPPTRLSAYWAIGFGICMSSIDYLIHDYVRPLWDSDFMIPVWVSMAVSALCYFMILQVITAANRYHRATLLSGVDHTPAVMFNKIPRNGSFVKAAMQGFFTALIGGGIALGVSMATMIAIEPLNAVKTYILIGIAVLTVSLFVYGMFRNLTKVYREEFDKQIQARDKWNDIWEFKNKLIPYFEMEVPVPGQPGKPGGPPEGYPEPEPHVWAATFSYPMNGRFTDYAGDADLISPSIANQEMVVITPIPRRNNQGESIEGTVSAEGFRVWWSDEYISVSDLLVERDITEEQKNIAIRANIVEPLASIKGINRCIMHSYSMMTAEDSPIQIMRVSVVAPEGVTDSDFTSKISKIRNALGVAWVRAKSRVDHNGRTVIDIFVGNGSPNNPEVIFPRGIKASWYKKELLSVDWEYSFAMNKVVSPEGKSPSVMLSKDVMGTSNQIVFDIPAGISMNTIRKAAAEGLKTTSGNNFLEVHQGITDEKKMSRKEKREISNYIKKNNGSVSQFTAVASPTHPLEKVFLFSEYKDKLITGREPGVTKIAWSPGVKSNGSLATHDFNKDMPHLVLAGSSGSGKSVLIYSMICQLIANNGPEDLQIWIIDPKIGYQNFEGLDSVTRYVDSWTPSEDFFTNVRDLFREAAEEMKRRNGIFRFAQRDGYAPADSESIDKLAVARRIGIEQGPMPDGSPNPLIQPYIFIIIDEAAMLFAGASDPETKELQKEILYYAVKLARESRSAGIHMLISTQYPTKESIPTIIKQQSGRLGLKTQDQIASKVIIDEPGLEDLELKGEGMLLEGSEKHVFRGFLLEEDGLDEHSMSEIIANTPRVEQHTTQTAVPGSGQEEYVDMPEPDSSVFGGWDKATTEAARRLKLDMNSGKEGKDPYKKIKDKLDSMSDEEFDNLTLEEFKKMF